MTRFHKLLLALAVTSVLALALKIRNDEAGYVNYYRGNFAEAVTGLAERAEDGEPFSAMLVGNIYAFGKGLDSNHAKATKWYLKQAKMGDITGVRFFVQNAFRANPEKTHDSDTRRCQTAVELLDMAARAGDLGANIELGIYYRSGFCAEQNYAMAAKYFQMVSRLDRKLSFLFDKIRLELTYSERAGLESGSPAARATPSISDVFDKMLGSAPVLMAPGSVNGK